MLNDIEEHYRQNPRFEKKTPLTPVQSPGVLHTLQIDLVDLSLLESNSGNKYVLSVLDISTR